MGWGGHVRAQQQHRPVFLRTNISYDFFHFLFFWRRRSLFDEQCVGKRVLKEGAYLV